MKALCPIAGLRVLAASAWNKAAPDGPHSLGTDPSSQAGAPLPCNCHNEGLIKTSHDIVLSADSSQGKQLPSSACSQASTPACPQTEICLPPEAEGEGR